MYTFGTLGHVDHGKSTLVRALTGIDPDRLAEEKTRQMTIDLGFAWLPLSNGQVIGIVDVPGHRDFIENMLSGVTSIDAALLIIAADEGIMPQTREHIAILNLLNIQYGVVVLTKTDMIEDADWFDLIEGDIRTELAHTPLANSPIVRVSAREGTNLSQLIAAIEHCVTQMPPQTDVGLPQLAIDRVFSMHGFGTVVTGTLKNGSLNLGDEIEINPGGLRSRIRTLQTHNAGVSTALPGNRTAVNIPSIHRDALHRGQVITRPGQITPTSRLDVFVSLLDDFPMPLKHSSEVKLFVGTMQVAARVRVLGAEEIPPGTEGWLQLETHEPIVANKGDRFVLRQPSPSSTMGGGEVVNPSPSGRHRRFKPEIVEDLETRRRGSPQTQLAQLAGAVNPMKREALRLASGFDANKFEITLKAALDEQLIIELGDDLFVSLQRASAFIAQIIAELTAYHKAFPLQRGAPQEMLRARLGVKAGTLQALVQNTSDIVLDSGYAALKTHRIVFNDEQQRRVQTLNAMFAASPFTPPSYTDAVSLVGQDILDALITLGEVVRVSRDVIFDSVTFEHIVRETLSIIDADGSITVATIRDRFATSRKYSLAILESLDAQGITKRINDLRVRGPKA